MKTLFRSFYKNLCGLRNKSEDDKSNSLDITNRKELKQEQVEEKEVEVELPQDPKDPQEEDELKELNDLITDLQNSLEKINNK
jgi:hypothetical protein